jgi:hypothetical protein
MTLDGWSGVRRVPVARAAPEARDASWTADMRCLRTPCHYQARVSSCNCSDTLLSSAASVALGSSMVAPRTRQMCPTTRPTLWSMQTRPFFRGCACPRSQTLRFCTRESFPGGHPFTSTESHSPTSPLAGVLPGIGPPFCTCELSAGTGSSQVQKRYPGRRKTPARWGGALRGSVRVNGCPPSRRSRTEPSRQTARVARRSAPTQREPPLLQGVATGAEAMPLLDVWTNALATRTRRNDGQSPRGKCIIVNGFTTICECDESPFYELRSKVPRDNTKQTIHHLKIRA